jgi:hypothetical protein
MAGHNQFVFDTSVFLWMSDLYIEKYTCYVNPYFWMNSQCFWKVDAIIQAYEFHNNNLCAKLNTILFYCKVFMAV